MIVKRILPAVLFLCTFAANGQISVGNRIGYSLFKQTVRANDPHVQGLLSGNMIHNPGIALGIPVEIQMSNSFAIQPELGYVMKGAIHDANYWQDIRLNYADLTLLAKFMIEQSRWRAEFFAGPGVSYGISVRYIRELLGDPQNVDDLMTWKFTNYRSAELHVTGGAGISYAVGVPRIFLNYRYMHGIGQLLKQQQLGFYDPAGPTNIVEVSVYNRGHIVSAGLMVPLSRAAWARTPATATPKD